MFINLPEFISTHLNLPQFPSQYTEIILYTDFFQILNFYKWGKNASIWVKTAKKGGVREISPKLS